MNQLFATAAQLRLIGRCALVGTLAGLLASQSFAEGGVTIARPMPSQPQTTSFPGITQPLTINTQPTTNLPSLATNTISDNAPLPEAPTTTESASATAPPMLHLMLDQPLPDAQQSMQSTPAPKHGGVQRPGMLIMGIIGVPLIVAGAALFSVSVPKDNGLKNGFAAILLVPGAAMSGFGFYYAFHKKN